MKQSILLGLTTLLLACNPSQKAQNDSENKVSEGSVQSTEVAKVEKPEQAKLKPSLELITDFGTMKIALYDETPKHKENFLKLANKGFFNDLLFHRVIQNFMIQGGDPQSKNATAGKSLGMGGPGYTIEAEFNTSKFIHKKGALSAARTGGPSNPQKRSSGSQFYIVQGQVAADAMLSQIEKRNNITYTAEQKDIYKTLGGTPFLDNDYTVFGEVIEGLDVIDKIAAVAKNKQDRPLKDVKMTVKVLN